MKLKSYKFLFGIFSFLSDKTNGAPLFVKYKLLLGTLILGIASSQAGNYSKKELMQTDTVKPDTEYIRCYEHIEGQDEIVITNKITDKYGEPAICASVHIKRSTKGTIAGADGIFGMEAGISDTLVFSYMGLKSREIPVSELIRMKEPVILEDDPAEISCYIVMPAEHLPRRYEPVIIDTESLNKKIEASKPESFLPYNEVQIAPISPVGDLNKFREWIEKSITNNKIQGQLILHFTIDKEGKVVDAKILSSLSPEADAEALRILSTSGQWQPGSHYGRNIKTLINIPVYFNANE